MIYSIVTVTNKAHSFMVTVTDEAHSVIVVVSVTAKPHSFIDTSFNLSLINHMFNHHNALK